MNKSKFLKKSLAMLLAIMMVVAMIPLSAAAAYEPAGVTPVSMVEGATPDGSGYEWSIEFPYNTEPKMTVDLGNPNDTVTVITADGSLSAHYEHTVAVTDADPVFLTFVEE